MRFIVAIVFVFCLSAPLSAQQQLIPEPIHLNWEDSYLDISNGVYIATSTKKLSKEKVQLERLFEEQGIVHRKKSRKGVPTVTLTLSESHTGKEGAYDLTVNANGIQISANSASGIFYGVQTLRQFDLSNKQVQFVRIQDEPAFSWRAFLLDVGRNYQPLSMLKEQIDVMAQYKLNVLHFHFTEDIAWRLASKKYPGLTDASIMTRWAGDFYTEKEFKELIEYCQERHIMLLPEIDMPGHSAAFTRFFGVDMQSDSGMMYIKELLQEFADTYRSYDLPYLHIGGDEVKITNKNFMPEITRFVEDLGFKTIGWDPGSNLESRTIHQLWMGGPKPIEEKGEVVYIDSKHLYINHMDPLETVVTLYHRQIGAQPKENKNLLGATLCSWPDRAVAKQIDMFYQSALYPSLLTFAERIWRGGGEPKWVSNIVDTQTAAFQDFVNFEKRLIAHKNRYFQDKPFPYVQQSNLEWELIGPFDNGGDVHKKFDVENNIFAKDVAVAKAQRGGTVVMRHWWSNVLPGAVDNPQPNTTWFARTKIWSDEAVEKPFWIGFNDLSRSYMSDTPELGTWDDRGSEVRVNGQLIAPPQWQQAGSKGEPEKPLIDEGYSYRTPTLIPLKKGWNEVVVKVPVASFAGKDWQNPVKWMFTCIPLEN